MNIRRPLESYSISLGHFWQNKYKTKSKKIHFCVKVGKFLGYIVSERGIEAKLDKIKAILNMQALRCINNVQKLNRRVTALGRSISYSVKRCLPFLKSLKGKNNFIWKNKCVKTFNSLEDFLSSPSLLSSPKPGEVLFFVANCDTGNSELILVREEDNEQNLIYHINQVLKGLKLNSPPLEKLTSWWWWLRRSSNCILKLTQLRQEWITPCIKCCTG